jgi:hypothetical protein
MEVQLNDEYRISSDSFNFILERKGVVQEGEKTGAVKWTQVGFYPTIKATLEDFANVCLRRFRGKTWFGLQNRIKQLQTDINNVSKALGVEIREVKEEGENLLF